VSLTPGTRLAQYEILAPLGAGGMGEVFRARDSHLDRDVAIKVLSDHLASNPAMRARFEREARSVAALSHPGILGIHELAIVDGRSFAVMELLEGESLRAAVARGPMPWRRAVAIGIEIAEALAAAHERGIVHRDLKPENVFLTAEGRTKILDFGLARSLAEAPRELPPAAETLALTEPGMVLGTVGYMAPEQVRGEEAGAPADVFALGCILYEMIRGERAFSRPTPADTIVAVLGSTPALPADIKIPPTLSRVVAHCLEKDPGERFQRASDVAVALRALVTDSGVGSGPVPRRRARTGKSLAVMPFVNVSGDAGLEYLIDGITESIINGLSQLPRLRVVPRSTVFRYKGRQIDVTSAGLALNVNTLVMGRVVQHGDVLNIQAELVDVATESQLWGDQYRRRIDDVVTVQEEIAWQISEALRIRLSGEEKKKLRRRPTRNAEAYQDYLRGRYHWNKWTAEDFRKAVEYFERAIDRDPTYALAYSGLSDAYGAMGYYGYLPPETAMPRSKAAAYRALELDESLAEAHTTAGMGLMFYDWNWEGAEREFQRAVELNPRYPTLWIFYSLLLTSLGRSEEAVAHSRRAEALDPLSPISQMAVAWALYFAGHIDEAHTQVRHTLQMSPQFAEANHLQVLLLESNGELEQAADAFDRVLVAQGGPPGAADALKEACRTGGPAAYWALRLERLADLAATMYVPSYAFAALHARGGDPDAAFARLDKAVDERAGHILFVKVDPCLASLRSDPRFAALLARIEAVRHARPAATGPAPAGARSCA
jgi:serine/threonine protein kinase/tetratricopeptide (TPR) repeat protein